MKKNKLFFLLAVLAVCFNFLTVNGAMIPYLPMKTDFGGTQIDPAAFELPSGDFTLEVHCGSSSEIHICGVYTYHTENGGKIRFARKKDILYVYEGNTYVTTVTPELVPLVPGISGVSISSASYLGEMAFAPEFTLSGEDYFDITSYVNNPNFDMDVTGWTTTTGATSKRGSGVLPGEAIDGPGGYWQNWKGSPFSGKMYQAISGLPNGKYKLRAAAYTDKQADHEWMFLYANDSRTPITGAVSEFYEVEGIVLDGTLEIGIIMTEAVPTLVGLDNVQLFYYGADLSSLVEALNDLINKAKECAARKMNATVLQSLNTAISKAEAAVNSPTEQGIQESSIGLKEAMTTAQASATAYGNLNTAIEAASANLPNYQDYPGYADFATSVETAKSKYDAAEMEAEEELNALILSLKAAEVACRLTQPGPFDATFAVTNPGFEDPNSFNGWINNGMQTQTNSDFPLKEGTRYVEKWTNYPNALADGSISQTITGLPNGEYKMTVVAHSVNHPDPLAPAEGGYLFAGSEETAVGEDGEYTVEAIVLNHTLTIGFKIRNATANWVTVDNFQLYYVGYTLDVATEALQQQVDAAYGYTDVFMEKSVSNELWTAVKEAENAIASPTEETVNKAADRLLNAMNAAQASIESYNRLDAAIAEAEPALTEAANLPGHEEFNRVFEEMISAFNEGNLDEEGIEAAIRRLKEAEIICYLSQKAPFDATFAILNPGFEEGSRSVEGINIPTSWQMTHTLKEGDIKVSNATPAEGTYKYNVWSGNFTSADLYQEIWLSEGHYSLSAALRTDNEGNITNQHIYAEIEGQSSVSSPVLTVGEEYWQSLSVIFEVPAGGATVRIGAASEGPGGSTAGWFQIDDFRLTCLDHLVSIVTPTYQSFTAIGTKGGVVVTSDAANGEIAIYSVTGILLRTQPVEQGDVFIPLAPGMYIISGEKIIVQ